MSICKLSTNRVVR